MAQNPVIEPLPTRAAWLGWRSAEPRAPGQPTGKAGRLVALTVLVLLADFLFYAQPLGQSLALYALALYAAASALRPAATPLTGPLTLLAICALPVVDYVQPLSLGFLALGLLAALGWMILGSRLTLATGAWRLAQLIPFGGARSLHAGARTLRQDLRGSGLARRLWRAWAFPIGGGLVLLQLLAAANPLLADWLHRMTRLDANLFDSVLRAGFWLGIGLLVWPFLVADRTALARPVALPGLRLPGIGINGASVARALIAFNLMLGVQTVLDALFLWSGAALPPAMTLATYAHRGAYPLLATALLAGAFALAARPWLAQRPMLKPLLLLWLGQNVLLTLSALYRLELYVESFGLTYLRVHAGIWMALVAAGLALTAWQVAASRDNPWLVRRCGLLGLATLYVCAFVNFAAIIASVNVAEGRIDIAYLCDLGPSAAAAIPPGLTLTRDATDCHFQTPHIDGWRDRGFRDWQVIRYLDHGQGQGDAVENSGRR